MNSNALQKRYGFENPFKPDPLTIKALPYCKGKKLLDVGCGEGADSVCYAKKGFSITALDKNPQYLKRFQAYCKDQKLSNIALMRRNLVSYRYPRNAYDVVICLLVICCMKRSEFERMIVPLKRSVKPGGVVVMSSRNYLDPELNEYHRTERPIESSTFRSKEDCCGFLYFIERNRLREALDDFETLYYFEGMVPCKYNEHPIHGDSHIICKRKR